MASTQIDRRAAAAGASSAAAYPGASLARTSLATRAGVALGQLFARLIFRGRADDTPQMAFNEAAAGASSYVEANSLTAAERMEVARAMARVLAEPLADFPREDYARLMDELGDPRGDFIRYQIAAFRTRDAAAPEVRRRNRAAERLLGQHGAQWAGEVARLVDYYVFSRGFIELVGMSAHAFLERSHRLFKLAPVMHLELRDAAPVARELLSSQQFAGIQSLSLDTCGLGDREAELLAGNPALRNLRWLSLANNAIGREGVRALASSEHLRSLHFVNLFGNRYDPGPRFAHEDSRVVDAWYAPEFSELARQGNGAPWLSVSRDLLPDRFHLAGAAALEPSPQLVPA